MGQCSPERFRRWASTIGPNTATLTDTVLRSRRHPQQAFRSCLGILRLAHSYAEDRLEAAAGRAVALGAHSYRSVESSLNHRLDQRPSEQIELALPIEHDNIRGASYYNGQETSHVDSSHRGQAPPTALPRDGQGPGRAAPLTRGRRPQLRGTPRAHRRPRTHRTPLPPAHQPAATRPAAPLRLHRGHRLPPTPRPRPRPRALARRRALGPRPSQCPRHRTGRGGKNLDRLRSRPQRVPHWIHRLVPAPPAAADRTDHRPRRRTLCQTARLTRQDRRPGHRRLGDVEAQRREPARPARNRRGPPWAALHHCDLATPCAEMACRHRRPHPRRRHSRPARPQRLSTQPERRIHAKNTVTVDPK